MRPVRLDIRGFTAFREPQQVDFEGLDLFAITGPTGSGKSSILDALTFVLYGRAERVGDGVRQLVSQGQPRAAVALEFEAGGERYRVARSVTADGKTKILVERADPSTESGWRQHGDGADRVREADAIVERLVGLDYAGFTRAVLLPQGRFAEFLAGDAKTRRKILADLLDLGLFERIAAKAGELARTHGAQVTGRAEILASEFADATDAGLAAARHEHEAARAASGRLSAVRESVAALVVRGAAIDREIEELGRIGAEATRGADLADTIVAEIGQLIEAIERAEVGRESAIESADRDAQAAAVAAGVLVEAESSWGDAATLAGRLERARALSEGRAALAERREQASALSAAIKPAEDAATTATLAASEAASREASAAEAERQAVDALEAARQADRVAAISAGLAIGDPCPICGRPLEATPDRHGAPKLDAATTALELARASAAEAAAVCRATERAATEAAGLVELERDRAARAEATLAEEDDRLAGIAAALATELGGKLPKDPVAELERRSDELRRLTAELDGRRTTAAASALALRTIEQLLAEVRGRLTTERVRLEGIHADDLLSRASAAGVAVAAGRGAKAPAATAQPAASAKAPAASAKARTPPKSSAPPPKPELDDDPAALALAATDLAARLGALADAAGAARSSRADAATG
ncbi:MAG: repair protein SbcC/Rad50, partial [Chloroflexota bacterium]|nr:repair protein SbcC/Rad50 [Chloroflexota bacterium]